MLQFVSIGIFYLQLKVDHPIRIRTKLKQEKKKQQQTFDHYSYNEFSIAPSPSCQTKFYCQSNRYVSRYLFDEYVMSHFLENGFIVPKIS